MAIQPSHDMNIQDIDFNLIFMRGGLDSRAGMGARGLITPDNYNKILKRFEASTV